MIYTLSLSPRLTLRFRWRDRQRGAPCSIDEVLGSNRSHFPLSRWTWCFLSALPEVFREGTKLFSFYLYYIQIWFIICLFVSSSIDDSVSIDYIVFVIFIFDFQSARTRSQIYILYIMRVFSGRSVYKYQFWVPSCDLSVFLVFYLFLRLFDTEKPNFSKNENFGIFIFRVSSNPDFRILAILRCFDSEKPFFAQFSSPRMEMCENAIFGPKNFKNLLKTPKITLFRPFLSYFKRFWLWKMHFQTQKPQKTAQKHSENPEISTFQSILSNFKRFWLWKMHFQSIWPENVIFSR